MRLRSSRQTVIPATTARLMRSLRTESTATTDVPPELAGQAAVLATHLERTEPADQGRR